MTPSQKFKALREKLGMFQVEAAEFLNISERQVQLMESDKASDGVIDEHNYKMACEMINRGALGLKDKVSLARSTRNINSLVRKVYRQLGRVDIDGEKK